MAKVTQYIDDITKEPIEKNQGGTVRVGLDGQWWEVDLSDESKEKLEKILEPYLVNRVPSSPARSTAPSGVTRAPMTMKYSSATMAEATAWAKTEAGAKYLKDRKVSYSGVGRTPYAVVEAYLETQK